MSDTEEKKVYQFVVCDLNKYGRPMAGDKIQIPIYLNYPFIKQEEKFHRDKAVGYSNKINTVLEGKNFALKQVNNALKQLNDVLFV